MKKEKILILDDNLDLCDSISSLLEMNGYEVSAVDNITDMLTNLSKENISLILSDVFLGKERASDVVKVLNERGSKIPVLLMTGFPDSKELINLLGNANVKDFLVKPFVENDLIKAVEAAVNNVQSFRNEDKAHNFIEIPFNAIISDVELNFDLYIKLKEYKYIKIAYCGSILDKGRLQQYTEKELRYFHVHIGDLPKVLELGVLRLEFTGLDINKLSEEERDLFYYLGEPIYSYLSEQFKDKKFFEQIHKYVELFMSYMISDKNIFSVIKKYKADYNKNYFHGFSVAFIAGAFCLSQSDFIDSDTFNIVMAGMLHDIGQTAIPQDIVTKNPVIRTFRDKSIYKKHVDIGVKILSKIDSIPKEVLRIVKEHHENFDGSGYPEGLKGKEIHPYSQVINLSNIFIDYLFAQKEELFSVENVMNAIKNNHMDKFDKIIEVKFELFVKSKLKLREVGES